MPARLTDTECAPEPRLTSKWKFACFGLWIVAGLACIRIDRQIQPIFRSIGRTEHIHEIAKAWQQSGATWGIALFLLAGVVCLRIDRGRTLVYFVMSVSMAGLAVQLLKRIIGRVRPSVDNDTTRFFGPSKLLNNGIREHFDSMPSGHTAAAFAMAVALAYRWPQLRWLWYGSAVGVGVSRVVVDAHFPSDVILGACLGTLVGLTVTHWLTRAWPLEPGPAHRSCQ